MNQVTCSLCGMENDESQWKEHIFSTNYLQFCKDYKDEVAIKFFELIFRTYLI